MIENKKFKYSTGNEFSFKGENYIGYYNVNNGVAYKTRDRQDDILESKNNISSLIELGGEYFDRNIQDTLVFKNKLEDILFAPNEIINKNSINYKMELLYDNFQDLYKFSKIQNPNIPYIFNKFAIVSAYDGGVPEFKWFDSDTAFLSASRFNKPLADFNPILSAGKINLTLVKGSLVDNYTLFTSVSNTIFSFDVNSDNFTFNHITSTNKVGIFEDLNFSNIVSVASDGNSTLYVSDSGNNSLYKIDVNSIVNRDRNNNRSFVLTDVIGNSGTALTNFGEVNEITFGDDFLFVYDRNANSIKHYSKDLNLLKIFKRDSLLSKNNFVNFKYNSLDKKLYVLMNDFSIFSLNIDNFNVEDNYKLNKNKFIDENLKDIQFSKNNSNIYYIITDKNVYKYFINRKNLLISKFNIRRNLQFNTSWEESFTDFENTQLFWESKQGGNTFNLIDLSLIQTKNNYDNIILLDNNKFLEIYENNETKTLLNNEFPDFIDKQDILITDEFFNNITYNNLIYKFLINVDLLFKEIGKKIEVKFIDDFLFLDNFKNIDSSNKENILINEKDFFVGVNETISTKVFNRTLSNVYSYMEKIIPFLNSNTVNTRISPLTTITF